MFAALSPSPATLHRWGVSIFCPQRDIPTSLGLKRCSGENRALMGNLKGSGNNKRHKRSIDPNLLAAGACWALSVPRTRRPLQSALGQGTLEVIDKGNGSSSLSSVYPSQPQGPHLGRSSLCSARCLHFLINRSSGKNCPMEMVDYIGSLKKE